MYAESRLDHSIQKTQPMNCSYVIMMIIIYNHHNNNRNKMIISVHFNTWTEASS